ncbi:hypothetical protein [Sphingomonas sp. BE137]|uniref:hypothetical protein n=1 Tax=Sphingomonas sp. BE137 TaxID=2817844 RepID=UPI001AE56EF1|nr:hypothetical protein [Sphingomonas sp. BE137]MDR6850341.1 hypothetical protein [Sphingomonas sp. BE137]
MRWPAFLTRSPRRPTSTPEQLRAFDEQLDRNLQSRKVDRAARQERARRGAATKVHQALTRDPLLNAKAR